MWPWKWGQGHQNLITSFPHPNNVSLPVWSNSTLVSEERVQTRSYAGADRIRTKSTMPPLPFCFWRGWGVGVHKLALIDPVVSEKIFEECGRRHRRACLYDKLTNQYIKHSARIMRSKIGIYFRRCCKRRQSNRTRLHRLISLFQTSHTKRFWNAILLWNCSEKTNRTDLHIYRFNLKTWKLPIITLEP